MARRRRKQQEDPTQVFGFALFVGVMYAGVSGNWGLLTLLIFIVAGVLAVFVLRVRGRKARARALRDLQTLSPREPELHVAQVIAALPGWRAEATRGSSDQGADVIAAGPGGVRVAVQVKHYRGNVGNGAVQEIVASKAFYRCAHAVVVTSGPGYTRPAQALAKANGVPLWGPDELFQLQVLASREERPPRELLPS